MAKGFKKGAGGANPMNFKVVGGTTAPANPKENTIWVNTDTAISSWVFSATQPEAPAEGVVWFSIGTYSLVAFNALKKNGIEVYPLSAKQYVSGAWVNKTAKSYQGGAWVDWIVYLYNEGNEFTDITGGWESYCSVYVYDGGTGYGGGKAPTVTRSSDNLTITAKNCSGLVHTVKRIDLTSVKTVKMKGSILPYNQNETTGIYIMSDLIQGYKNKGAARCLPASVGKTSSGEFSVDVSSLTGEYYICLAVGEYSNTNTAKVVLEKMWME